MCSSVENISVPLAPGIPSVAIINYRVQVMFPSLNVHGYPDKYAKMAYVTIVFIAPVMGILYVRGHTQI